jgi:thiopurine S-methyltransferase
MNLDQSFWEKQYKINQTGWDIGYISSPIKQFFDSIKNKEIKILIPGCGYGHEAEYLFLNGFKNISIIDISKTAIKEFKTRVPNFPEKQIFINDFFNHNYKYDLVLEQTFFCAINPKYRMKYVEHCHKILKKNGFITGLLFNQNFKKNHPPYGGSEEEYKTLFKTKFKIIKLEKAINSIKARQGKELFFRFQKLD